VVLYEGGFWRCISCIGAVNDNIMIHNGVILRWVLSLISKVNFAFC
jgi:hypothetical protein